jgi:hypothetical protein
MLKHMPESECHEHFIHQMPSSDGSKEERPERWSIGRVDCVNARNADGI